MTEDGALSWDKYEMITKYIYETLGKDFGVKIVGYGRKCKVTGKSGIDHQIDVLTAHSDGIHSYQTAIECKYWEQKITKDIVMKVSEIVEDAGINKGIIVSKSGFTQDTLDYARYRNVGLVELRESSEKDLDGGAERIDLGWLEIRVKCSILRPEILGLSIERVGKNDDQSEAIDIYATTIKLSDGRIKPFTTFIEMFQEELRSQNKLFQPITKRYEINGHLINRFTNTCVQIQGVAFRGVLKKIDSNSDLKFSIIDQVWLIMKSIFEGRTFQISKSGAIVETGK